MIIFAKEDGRVESSPSFMPKGSGGVPVQVFAPYFAGCTCEVWVNPPSALQLDPAILSPEFGGTPGVWAGKLPPGTADSPGRGDYQLRFTDATGTAVATLAGTYTVQRGVVDSYPENMDDLSNYSLKAFTILLAQFANQFNDVITSDTLQEEMKEVEYTMKLSKNVLSWGISGKILASVILTGLIGSTGCVFSEKENRESLATILESVPIIAETESEAAEINTTRAELVTALRETTEEPDEPIVETYTITVSVTDAYATINGQTYYTTTAIEVESGESVEIRFSSALTGYSVNPSDGAVIECGASYVGKEDGDDYIITFTPGSDTLVSCVAAKVESPAVLSRLEVTATGFQNSVNGYSLYVGEGSPYNKYGDLRDKLTVYAIYTKDGVESRRVSVSSYMISNETSTISAEIGGYAALEVSYNGVSGSVLFDLVSSDQIQSSALYINSQAVSDGGTVSLNAGTSFADMVKSNALYMGIVYNINGAVNTSSVSENLFTVEGYDELGSTWIDTSEVVAGTNLYKIRYGNSAIGYATYNVTIVGLVKVTGISISASTANLSVGDTLQLTATVQPTNATNQGITWSSSAPSYATVSNGLVTIKAYPPDGTIRITAKADGNASATATCTITVAEAYVPVTGITLSQTSAALKVGDTLRLTATVLPVNATYQTINWYSSSDYVTVGDGLVTALYPISSATIYAQSIDNSTVIATCQISVSAVAVETITISPTSLSLKVGETAEVSYSFTPENATEPSFNAVVTSELEVVSHDTVNREVVVKAISEGEGAIAIADTGNSASATCTVTVEAASAGSVTSATATGSTGKTIVDATLNVTQAEALTVEPNKITAEVTYDYNNTNSIKKLTLTKDESGNWNGSVERKGGGTYAYVDGQYATVTISGGKVTAIKTANIYFSESLPSLAMNFIPDNDDGTPAYNLTVEAV